MTSFTADDIRTIAVIGAGTMGHGIAQVCAQIGATVHLYDALQGGAQAGLDRVKKNLDKGVELGKVTPAERDLVLGRLAPFDEITPTCRDVDCVIEAAPEHIELKREIFAAADKLASPHALFATNTSSLPVSEIASSVADPGRVVGMHFFNPAHLMKLVEIVRHPGSNPDMVDVAVGLVARMGKSPIVVADSPGFASSRLGLVIGLEAMRMVEQGVASAADIDTAMKLGYGHPMGPLETPISSGSTCGSASPSTSRRR